MATSPSMTDEDLARIEKAIDDCCYPWEPIDLHHVEVLLAEVKLLRAANMILQAQIECLLR